MQRVRIVIVSPALAEANNGNWQTARRWQRMLSPEHGTRIVREWPDAQSDDDELMIALHARRSASAIAAWAAHRGSRRLAVVLTGTDLYRDIARGDAHALQSLALARALVVLQDQALRALPGTAAARARVIVQSTPSRATLPRSGRRLRALMVGHLREEKDPLTLMRAAALLADRTDIRIDHVGAPLDAALGEAAQRCARDCPGYRWLGALAHEATRRRIQRAHVLVHASRMEGGAHVVMEAVCSGTPVIASRIDGNVGLLGADHPGYFEAGDAAGLAALLREARDTQARPDGLLARLLAHGEGRRPLFAPEAERRALRALVDDLRRD